MSFLYLVLAVFRRTWLFVVVVVVLVLNAISGQDEERRVVAQYQHVPIRSNGEEEDKYAVRCHDMSS